MFQVYFLHFFEIELNNVFVVFDDFYIISIPQEKVNTFLFIVICYVYTVSCFRWSQEIILPPFKKIAREKWIKIKLIFTHSLNATIY